MTPERLREMRQAATGEIWAAAKAVGCHREFHVISDRDAEGFTDVDVAECFKMADADLIASMFNALPLLLDIAEAASARPGNVEGAIEALGRLNDVWGVNIGTKR